MDTLKYFLENPHKIEESYGEEAKKTFRLLNRLQLNVFKDIVIQCLKERGCKERFTVDDVREYAKSKDEKTEKPIINTINRIAESVENYLNKWEFVDNRGLDLGLEYEADIMMLFLPLPENPESMDAVFTFIRSFESD